MIQGMEYTVNGKDYTKILLDFAKRFELNVNEALMNHALINSSTWRFYLSEIED